MPSSPSIAMRGSRAAIAFLESDVDAVGNPVTNLMWAGSNDAGANWPGGGSVVGGLAGLSRMTPKAAVSANGDVNIAWQESRFGGSGFEIRSARTPDSGQSWGVVNRTGTAASSIIPALAGGAGNRVIHFWAEGTIVRSY